LIDQWHPSVIGCLVSFEKKTGSGIGLSLSRQIMQLHQGTLTVKSVVDEGSTFVMKF